MHVYGVYMLMNVCICLCIAPLPPEGGSSLEDLHLAFSLSLGHPGASREDVLVFLVYETYGHMASRPGPPGCLHPVEHIHDGAWPAGPLLKSRAGR